jgi:hypothetical protein
LTIVAALASYRPEAMRQAADHLLEAFHVV